MRFLIKNSLIGVLMASWIFSQVETLRVGRMVGNVRFALRGNSELMTLKPGQSVPSSSAVVTAANSSVDLHFPDGSVISVAPNSRFRLDKMAAVSNTDTGTFSIDYGKILSKFSKLDKKRDLQFVTPSSIAGVRGTAFGIDVSKTGDAKLLVTEGTVAFGGQEVPAGSVSEATKDAGAAPPKPATTQDIAAMEQGVPGGFKDLGTRPVPAPVNDSPAKDTGTGDTGTSSGGGSTASTGTGDTGSKTTEEPKKSSGSGDTGFSFLPDFGYGVVTIDGATWSRFNFSPEIRIGKFGLGLDLELFLNEKGSFSARGWEFATAQQAVDSLTRKFNFISWNKKDNVVFGKDHFYFRFGTIQNFTLGMGIIMKGYANTVNYPAEKNFGMELALGNISPVKIGFEGMVNSFSDLSRNGMLYGGRVFMTPLGATKVPLLSKIQIGASYVGDINQFASLKDFDADGVPDGVDRFPSNKEASNYSATQYTALSNYYSAFGLTNGVDWVGLAKTPPSVLNQNDYFGMWGLDLVMPITSFLRVYGQMAMNHDPLQLGLDHTEAVGFGIAAPGAYVKIGDILELQAEFRRQDGAFQSTYFNRRYDASRAVYQNGNTIITRDSTLSNYSASGFYAGLSLNLFVIIAQASYEQLFKDGTSSPRGSFDARANLSPDLIKKIPILKKIIGQAEAYFIKQRVDGMDSFFTLNETVTFGFDLSVRIAGPVHLQGRSQVTYSLNASGQVVQNNPTFNFGMVTKF